MTDIVHIRHWEILEQLRYGNRLSDICDITVCQKKWKSENDAKKSGMKRDFTIYVSKKVL